MILTGSETKLKKCCGEITAEQIVDALVAGAEEELLLTPKPGLVDIYNSGSHKDIDYTVMCKSIRLLRVYLNGMMYGVTKGINLCEARERGVVAEQMMMAECGSNTHKGYIFISGIMLLASVTREDIREGIKDIAETILRELPEGTKGAIARKEFGVGGIIKEAVAGFPAVFDDALPAFKATLAATDNKYKASLMAMARLMQTIEDTTALSRCGAEGLERIKSDGRNIEKMISEGEHLCSYLMNLNEEYVKLNLTMGGVADMLALTFALDEMSKGN